MSRKDEQEAAWRAAMEAEAQEIAKEGDPVWPLGGIRRWVRYHRGGDRNRGRKNGTVMKTLREQELFVTPHGAHTIKEDKALPRKRHRHWIQPLDSLADEAGFDSVSDLLEHARLNERRWGPWRLKRPRKPRRTGKKPKRKK